MNGFSRLSQTARDLVVNDFFEPWAQRCLACITEFHPETLVLFLRCLSSLNLNQQLGETRLLLLAWSQECHRHIAGFGPAHLAMIADSLSRTVHNFETLTADAALKLVAPNFINDLAAACTHILSR